MSMLGSSTLAWARSEQISKILIRGHKKIEEDAIRNKLVSEEGGNYSLRRVRQDVESLFELGYFYDVQIDRKRGKNGIILTYTVVEKPSVVEIQYKGNVELEDEELQETTELKAYEILDQGRIRKAIEKMEKLYEDKGFFLARIRHEVIPLKDKKSVRLVFEIDENEMVQVKRVTFLGNHQLSSGKLKSVMQTQEGGFFSFLSGSGAYKQDAFDRDLQNLNFLYFEEGFVQVKIDRPQVYVTPDKKGIYITVKIDEGQQFDIGEVDFTGDLLFSTEELGETIKTKSGERYKHSTLLNDLRALQAKYGDLGYAYANPIPRTRVREKDRRVDITFEIDKGNKVYIGRISVKGNSQTRDKVLRRELQIREGELYHETRKRESLANIKRLGFFEEVNFHTSAPKGRLDIMDIEIVVKERNTGTVQVGAGYSSFAKFVFNGQVNQINLLGRGQRLGTSLQLSQQEKLFNINFTEPYLMDTLWEAGFDAYQTIRNVNFSRYDEARTGGAIRIGHPLAPYLRGILRYKYDDTKLTLQENGDEELFPVETANGITSSVTASLIYDKRNDRFEPTKGIFSSVSLEYTGLGGDLKYTKGLATFRYYHNLFWNVTWRNNINYGFVNSNNPSRDVPFNQLFLLGGANTLRGYNWFSVGKRKKSTKAFDEAVAGGSDNAENDALRPFGGTQQFYYQMEFQFPLIEEAGIRGVLFYDIGNADDSLPLDEFRSDFGFGFRWFSPIGPLRFEWGFPVDRRREFGESGVNFIFQIGSPF